MNLLKMGLGKKVIVMNNGIQEIKKDGVVVGWLYNTDRWDKFVFKFDENVKNKEKYIEEINDMAKTIGFEVEFK